MPELRRGVLLGASAYLMWGLFPLYFPLLEPAGSLEILGHRVLWSALTMVVVVVLLRRRHHVKRLLTDPRRVGLLALAALAISLNWGGYIYGVTHARVVETALGYYINPLVTVLLGVVLLGERLRGVQWAAIGIATAAVLVLTAGYGRLPWIALLLAFSFASYGFAKKKADVGAVEGLTVETALVSPVAAAYLAFLGLSGSAQVLDQGVGHALLFTTAGLVTAAPLLCFGAAATRLPLSTIGLLQYLTPTTQFLLGVLWFGEPMPTSRWIGFALVWVALAMFSADALAHRRRRMRAPVAVDTPV